MARVLLTEAPPAARDRTENEKAPSVTGGAQKIPVRDIQRTRNLFESPAQGGLKNWDVHTMVVRSKSRMTILLKCRMLFATPATDREGCPVAGLRIFVNSIAYRWLRGMGRPLLAKRQATPLEHKQTERSCLCAISQLPRVRSSARGPTAQSAQETQPNIWKGRMESVRFARRPPLR